MPRPKKRPRLELKVERSGAVYYVIRDSDRRIATGVLATDAGGTERPEAAEDADRALTAYKAAQYEPAGGSRPGTVAIADALWLYTRDKAPAKAETPEQNVHKGAWTDSEKPGKAGLSKQHT